MSLGPSLSALVMPQAVSPIKQTVHAALSDLRIGIAAAPGSRTRSSRRRAAPQRIDLLVLIRDEALDDQGLDPFWTLPRPLPALFICSNVALARQSTREQALPPGGSVEAQVWYEGTQDLRWKLAQALARYLSGCFRVAQGQQLALMAPDRPERLETLAGLATDPDPYARGLAMRLVLAQADRLPMEAAALAHWLLSTGSPDGFTLIAAILRALARADPSAAQTLLTGLVAASSAFSEWVFATLAR